MRTIETIYMQGGVNDKTLLKKGHFYIGLHIRPIQAQVKADALMDYLQQDGKTRTCTVRRQESICACAYSWAGTRPAICAKTRQVIVAQCF